jgi:hypothetical protein
MLSRLQLRRGVGVARAGARTELRGLGPNRGARTELRGLGPKKGTSLQHPTDLEFLEVKTLLFMSGHHTVVRNY